MLGNKYNKIFKMAWQHDDTGIGIASDSRLPYDQRDKAYKVVLLPWMYNFSSTFIKYLLITNQLLFIWTYDKYIYE